MAVKLEDFLGLKNISLESAGLYLIKNKSFLEL